MSDKSTTPRPLTEKQRERMIHLLAKLTGGIKMTTAELLGLEELERIERLSKC